MTYSSVALLVDGDNLSSQMAGQILRKTADLGPHQVRRVYCNAHSVGSWSTASSFRTILSGSGKNGSDLVLSIEAMTFALRDHISAFAIATSDRDFSHLAHTLRELGRPVIGLGEAKTPKHFSLACTRFVQLSLPTAKVDDAKLDPIDMAVRAVLTKNDALQQGILVSKLNGLVRKEDASIKISEHPESSWLRYLQARPDRYELIGEPRDRRVRIATASPET